MKSSFGRRRILGQASPATVDDRLDDWDSDIPSMRRYRRWTTDFSATLDIGGQSYHCRVSDISPGGVRVRLLEAAGIAVGARLQFHLEGWGAVTAVVRHSARDVLGLEFLLAEDEDVELARWLVANRPERRQPRVECRVAASVRWAGTELPCVVTDISRTGARIDFAQAEHLAISSELTLLLPDGRELPASVRHAESGSVGLSFLVVLEGDLPG